MQTPYWQAPEMHCCDPFAYDARACDIWALGMLVFVLLNGEAPCVQASILDDW